MKLKNACLLGRKVMTNLDSILKSGDITLPTKFCLVEAMVFPVVMYGCEIWTVKKAECWRLDAFELWAGWHHRLNGCESEWTPGVGDGQGGLACCNSWGRKESDTTERLNWTETFLCVCVWALLTKLRTLQFVIEHEYHSISINIHLHFKISDRIKLKMCL